MKFVIGPDVAMWLAEQTASVPSKHKLLAPTLLRSEVLAWCYREVRAGRRTRKQADETLNYLRGLRIRLLGDRVLQQTAWQFAQQLDWADTFAAEYLALTKLQADALVMLDESIAQAARAGVARSRVSRPVTIEAHDAEPDKAMSASLATNARD